MRSREQRVLDFRRTEAAQRAASAADGMETVARREAAAIERIATALERIADRLAGEDRNR